jgi:uncharacterized protein (TIGR00369 family)
MSAGPEPASSAQELKVHSASVSFHDPADILPRLLGMGGLAYAEAVRDGQLPPDPFIEGMGFRLVEVELGRATYAAVPAPHHVNIAGTMHGGYMCALLDCATGYAMLTTLTPGSTAPHVSLSHQFLDSRPSGSEVRCTGELLRAGRRVGHVRGELRAADGRLLAVAQSVHAVIAEAPAEIPR